MYYQYITANTEGDLNYKVNEKLHKGWTLFGSPTACIGTETDGGRLYEYGQAVIMTESTRDEIGPR